MSFAKLLKKILPVVAGISILFLFTLTGCQPQAGPNPPATGDHEHESEGEHGERLPNDGAVVRILSPQDDAEFNVGEDIVIEIEVENFNLGETGFHWHVYVDGKTWAQVVGGGTREVIRGLEPGEHLIEVYLGLPTHEELEDGASIHITVIE